MDDRRSLRADDDFARALLRSAEVDEPSSAAYAKLATLFGVGTVMGVGPSLPASLAVGPGTANGARGYGLLAGKLAWVGVSGALLLGATGAYLWHRPTTQEGKVRAAIAAPRSRRLSLSEAQSRSVPRAPQPEPVNALPSSRLSFPVVAAPVRSPAYVSARSPHASLPVPRESSLSEQVQSLDRARIALGSEDARGALLEIAHYRQVWPEGVFLTEASVLEIEALAKRGERALAAERAKAFVAAHPDSPRAAHLRAFIPASRF